LRQKCNHLEKQVVDYRLQCEKLTAYVDAMNSQASEERQSATAATEALEAESSERTRLVKELQEVSGHAAAADRKIQKLELELMEYKNVHSAIGDNDSSEEGKHLLYQHANIVLLLLRKSHIESGIETTNRNNVTTTSNGET
jgi:chromosome segregation ATPase